MLWLQCEAKSVHTTLAFEKGTKGPQLALKKISNISGALSLPTVEAKPYQVYGSMRARETQARACHASRLQTCGKKMQRKIMHGDMNLLMESQLNDT